MITVYILFSILTDRYFVGKTSDFEKAINRHNSAKNKHTKSGMPWKIVYKERISDIQTANEREKIIKSANSRDELIEILKSKKNELV